MSRLNDSPIGGGDQIEIRLEPASDGARAVLCQAHTGPGMLRIVIVADEEAVGADGAADRTARCQCDLSQLEVLREQCKRVVRVVRA